MTIVRATNEGDLLWFNSSLITFKARSADTGGAFVLFEMLAPRGKATPLHLHPNEDESFYVLEGELLANVDGREVRAGAGGFVSFPRGTPHAFVVVSETARFLTLLTPGPEAAEAFFRDAGEPAQGPELPPEEPLDIPRIAASAERHGCVELLGPPPFEAIAAPAA
jgi:quercetin dioxygenase-like cupin family protein